jgi:FMN phosphatase YigB (HAD superfamily)
MSTIIIFDLDDTLVNHRMKIPRQTYHMLNKFIRKKYHIGIITYNCMIPIVAKETNLYKYTNSIYYKNCDRDLLFDLCLESIINDNKLMLNSSDLNIFYVDDRIDHLKLINEKNNKVTTYHCINMYELYKFKHFVSQYINS